MTRQPEIKGLRYEAVSGWFQNDYIRNAFEYDGLIGFFDYLEDITSHELEYLPNRLKSLMDWGLNDEVAAKVSSLGEDLHWGPGKAIFSILRTANNIPSFWPPTKEGWPADSPPNRIFKSTVKAIFHAAKGDLPDVELRSLIPIVFLSDPTRARAFLPEIPSNRIMVFHATSWKSCLSIEEGISLTRNSQLPRDIGSGLYLTEFQEYAMWLALEEPTRTISGQPAVIVYSLPRNYMRNCVSREISGDTWVQTVRHFRKGAILDWSPQNYDILKGPICRSANLVNTCEREPSPLPHQTQICMKKSSALRDLRRECIIFFKDRRWVI